MIGERERERERGERERDLENKNKLSLIVKCYLRILNFNLKEHCDFCAETQKIFSIKSKYNHFGV